MAYSERPWHYANLDNNLKITIIIFLKSFFSSELSVHRIAYCVHVFDIFTCLHLAVSGFVIYAITQFFLNFYCDNNLSTMAEPGKKKVKRTIDSYFKKQVSTF